MPPTALPMEHRKTSRRVPSTFTACTAAGGRLLDWDLHFDAQGRPELQIIHTGEPMGAVGRSLLGSAVGDSLETTMVVHDTWVETGTWAAEDDLRAWLPHLLDALHTARDHSELTACIVEGPFDREVVVDAQRAPEKNGRPVPPTVAPKNAEEASEPPVLEPVPGVATVRDVLAAADHPNVKRTIGPRWSVTVTEGPCPEPSPEPMGDPVEEKGPENADPASPAVEPIE